MNPISVDNFHAAIDSIVAAMINSNQFATVPNGGFMYRPRPDYPVTSFKLLLKPELAYFLSKHCKFSKRGKVVECPSNILSAILTIREIRAQFPVWHPQIKSPLVGGL